jgi:hypothetical protein
MVERRNRIIEESGRAMNMGAGLPPTLFIPACKYATTIQNFLPLKSVTFGKTLSSVQPLSETRNPCSQELWSRRNLGSWSDLVKNFRVYGCLAFILHCHPNKQVNKSERAIFLGLARNNHNAFVMMSLETKCFSRFITSRDVICHENILPFKKAMELPRAWISNTQKSTASWRKKRSSKLDHPAAATCLPMLYYALGGHMCGLKCGHGPKCGLKCGFPAHGASADSIADSRR